MCLYYYTSRPPNIIQNSDQVTGLKAPHKSSTEMMINVRACWTPVFCPPVQLFETDLVGLLMEKSCGWLPRIFRLLKQNTTDWMDCKQKFIFHTSGGWDTQDQGAHGICGEDPLPGSKTSSSCYIFTGQEGTRELSGASFRKALIPFVRAPSFQPNHFPKTLHPNTLTLRIKFQHKNFGRIQAFSL